LFRLCHGTWLGGTMCAMTHTVKSVNPRSTYNPGPSGGLGVPPIDPTAVNRHRNPIRNPSRTSAVGRPRNLMRM
jgi:hypothetical protein